MSNADYVACFIHGHHRSNSPAASGYCPGVHGSCPTCGCAADTCRTYGCDHCTPQLIDGRHDA